LESFSDSSIEWRPRVGTGTAAESESSDSEEDPDLENEEPDTMIKKKSGKKQKRGLDLRDRINKTAAAQLSDITGPNLDVHKRKAGPDVGVGAR
jgi:hypothetical protein